MVFRAIVTLIWVCICAPVIVWLQEYGTLLKAQVMAQQVQDSNVITASAKFFSGQFPATVVVIVFLLVTLLIWLKPIKESVK